MLTLLSEMDGLGVESKVPIPLKAYFSAFGVLSSFFWRGGFSM